MDGWQSARRLREFVVQVLALTPVVEVLVLGILALSLARSVSLRPHTGQRSVTARHTASHLSTLVLRLLRLAGVSRMNRRHRQARFVKV